MLNNGEIYVKRLIILAALITTQANANDLFMGTDWSQAKSMPAVRDIQVRSEDGDGIRTHKLNSVSVQVYGRPYVGRNTNDGICDTLHAWDDEGTIAYKNSQAVHTLYKPNSVCEPVYYPGFTFFGGQPNMALAPHWNGQPDFVPSSFGYMDWLDPRYNPAFRNGG